MKIADKITFKKFFLMVIVSVLRELVDENKTFSLGVW